MAWRAATDSSTSRLRRIGRLMRYARPYRAGWTAIVILTLACAGVGLAMPWPVQFVIDHVLGEATMSVTTARAVQLIPVASAAGAKIALAVGVVLLIYLLGAICDWLITVTWVRIGQRMVYDVVTDLMSKVQRQSLRFHHRHGVGDLMARLTGDSWCVYSIVDQILLGRD